MADNLTVTAGANATIPASSVIATDEVSSVHYQKVKVALGADGAVDSLLDPGQTTMANSIPVAIASDQTSVGVVTEPPAVPAYDEYWPVRLTDGSQYLTPASNFAILEGGLTELIGINEMIDNADYAASVGVALGGTYSGYITGILLVATSSHEPPPRTPYGEFIIFDENPVVAAGDTGLSAAVARTIVGKVKVVSDAVIDTYCGYVYVPTHIPFHAVSTLYFTFKNLATSFNASAGDDEQLQFNFWVERKT